VKAKCITEALDRFMKILRKTPALAAGDCWFNFHPSHQLYVDQTYQGDPAPAVFTRSVTGQLFSIRQSEERAGWPHPHSGDVKKEVGGDCADHRSGKLCRGVLAVVGAQQLLAAMLRKSINTNCTKYSVF
jgi:hypothetical protein